MKNRLLILIFWILATSLSFGQSEPSLAELQELYESFEFEKLIKGANNYLTDQVDKNKDDLIEVRLMKSMSHYYINELDSARAGFIEILKLDEKYTLDESLVSPKIVSFYNQVKQEYADIKSSLTKTLEPDPEIRTQVITRYDTIFVDKEKFSLVSPELSNLIIPGTGHLARDRKSGWFYITASAVLLGGIIYYAVESSELEEDYLNENNDEKIQDKYNKFNNAYKIRNGLILGYIGLWSYSQIDFYLFDDNENYQKGWVNKQFGNTGLRLSLRFNF